MKDKNLPQEPGFYWAAVDQEVCNTVVEVSGEPPFLRLRDTAFTTTKLFSILRTSAVSAVKSRRTTDERRCYMAADPPL